MDKFISVIVPVYNVEPYLERCIESILNQSYKNFELILVDDGSTDNSGRICDWYKKQDNRIQVIHKQNGGLSDARNVGIEWVLKNSYSLYLSFIDSDDFVHRKFLQWMIYAIEKKDADIAVCERTRDMDISCFLSQGSYAITEYNKHDFILSTYKGEWSRNIAACFKLYKRSIFESLRFPI